MRPSSWCGELRSDGNHGVNTAHVGKSEVHERNVRLIYSKFLDGFAAAGCLGYQLHVQLTVDDRGDALAQKGVVIDTEYPNAGRIAHRSLSVRGSGAGAFRGYNLANQFRTGFGDGN